MTPSASNTGCKTITTSNGNMTVTQANAVIENMDIHGVLTIKAPNVIVRNSVVRGGRESTGIACINVTHVDAKNCLIEDVTIIPEFANDQQNGININMPGTIRRVNISGTVDGVMVFGDNVTIQDSFIHDLVRLPTTTQKDGFTHNDGIQIQKGLGTRIVNNVITGGYNTAIMVTQDAGVTGNLYIADNYLDGGGATINFSSNGAAKKNLVIMNNRFGPNRRNVGMAIIRNTVQSPLTEFGNVWDVDGSPIKISNGA
jgi:hypothetical protein